MSNLSRAYRVNLTVLALVALFTGAFLVFSVLALSVAQRGPARLRCWPCWVPRRASGWQLVLAESALLGVAGSLAGLALGTALASAALQLLGGDLGGGYFAGVQPRLQWSLAAALLYGSLGVAAAVAGGWWPARAAQALPPAQTLKGLGSASGRAGRGWIGMVLIAASAGSGGASTRFWHSTGGLCGDWPAAGGRHCAAALGRGLAAAAAAPPWHVRHPLALLALERARRMRSSAAMAVGGVVASLSLAVALTVMVTSFRGSVIDWLDAVLPSPLYVRSALPAAGSDAALLPGFAAAHRRNCPGVERTRHALRSSPC